MERHNQNNITTTSTMMQSVALDQSARFPNDDDEYVVVEFRGAEPSQADPLEEIADDEDEEEYDYCDDIDSCSFAWHSGIPQSISFEEVSDRLGTSSAFYFGDEANQLLLELDNSASLLQEIPSFGGPVIASYPSCYDNTLSDVGFAAVGNTGVGTASSLKSPNAKHAEESSTTEKSKDFKEPSGAPITSVICEVHELLHRIDCNLNRRNERVLDRLFLARLEAIVCKVAEDVFHVLDYAVHAQDLGQAT